MKEEILINLDNNINVKCVYVFDKISGLLKKKNCQILDNLGEKVSSHGYKLTINRNENPIIVLTTPSKVRKFQLNEKKHHRIIKYYKKQEIPISQE